MTRRSAEDTALRLLAPGSVGAGERARTHALAEPALDWTRLLDEARAQGVAPLVAWNLERLGYPGVPAHVRAELQADRRATAAHNALLARELARVLRLLDGAGIPAMPMKGVALAETLYGDPTLRVSGDIDLLVPRDRARQALRLLREDGYAPEFAERFFETLLLRRHIEYTLTRRVRDLQYVVDLHWGIGWSARDDRRAAEALWADSQREMRCGVPTYVMSPEWELVTLAVHAARHGWRPLKWLVDVHDYCASRPLDWQEVCDIADRVGWLPALGQTLEACRALLDTPVPPILARRAPRHHPAAMTRRSAVPDMEPLLPLRLIGRWSDRARYLAQLLLVPTLAERRLVRLPSALGLLYYPLRPLRLAGKWGWHVLRGRAREAFR